MSGNTGQSQFPHPDRKRRGDILTAEEYNNVSKYATSIFSAQSGRGSRFTVHPGGISSMGDKREHYNQPATYVVSRNVDSVNLFPFDAVAITMPTQLQAQGYNFPPQYEGFFLGDNYGFSHIGAEFVTPRDWDFGRFGIVADFTRAGDVGRVWVDGIMFAWVAHYWNVRSAHPTYRKPDRCDTVRGQTYLQANHQGAAHILWLKDPTLNYPEPRPAIIQFDSRSTDSIGIQELGNSQNDGAAEVIEWNDEVELTKLEPGVVKFTRK